MKKLFLVGALAASMAFSSSALAAVTYGDAEDFTLGTDFSYNQETGVLTILADQTSASATTDTTILVLNGEKPTTFEDTDIMYIDQAAKTTEFGTDGAMGLLLPTTIEAGKKATLLINDGTAAIQYATFYLKNPIDNKIKFLWGDVNADTALDVLDASAILDRNIGGDTQFTDKDGNVFVIGETYGTIIWGDVNVDTALDVLDASAILDRNIGGDTQFTDENGATYSIGTEYSISK